METQKKKKSEGQKNVIAIVILAAIVILLFIGITGAALNFTVIQANGWKMPVLLKSSEDPDLVNGKRHFGFYESDDVKFPHLADIHKLKRIMFSTGDVLIYIAVFGTIALLLLLLTLPIEEIR